MGDGAVLSKKIRAGLAEVAVLIVGDLWSDLSGRKGCTDDIDDEVRAEILRTWYKVVAKRIGAPSEPPADFLSRMRR